mmetsp:Transcript_99115/g.171866  ORF Transcript_99115/g.171866 Transcript_99115/m.171866 type:complete len:202 (+) Transcript_99115:135-740(+)
MSGIEVLDRAKQKRSSQRGVGNFNRDSRSADEDSGQQEPMRRGMLGCAPTTENIVIWAAARIRYREDTLLVEPGRFYYSGIPRNVDPRLHEMLQSIFEHIHRDDHTERRAFLSLARAVVRRCGFEGLPDVSGHVGMYIAHFPCISCLAVICQFIRYFPAVRLDMDFDNMWKTRWKYGFNRTREVADQKYNKGIRNLAQKTL